MRAAASAFAAWGLAFTAAAATGRLKSEDLMIPSAEPGIQLHLRHVQPAGVRHFAAERIVLFVHGATFPSTSAFDFDMPGGSWLKYTAARGFDVYGLDIRGYGGSTRPAVMQQPPGQNPPFADSRDAVADIGAAVDYLLARHGVSAVQLLGWSWGTTTAAGYCAAHADRCRRLILVSPVWLPLPDQKFTGAYRTTTREASRQFFIRGVPAQRVEEISPSAQYERWWAETLRSDEIGSKQDPPVLRVPNGAVKDFSQSWHAGSPTYDPAAIRAPTLLMVGEWDQITPPSLAQELFSKLVNAQSRRLVLFSEASHFMLLESHHLRLFAEAASFLLEPAP